MIVEETSNLTPESLSVLLSKEVPGLKGLDGLKFYKRPFICPFHLLLEYIERHSSLYDIGFGSGLMLYLAGKTRLLSKLGGVEIASEKVKSAESLLCDFKDTEVKLQVYNGKVIPETIANYQYVSMIDVFHHIPKENQIKFIEELHEKMTPGAKLIFKDIDASKKFWLLFNKLHDFVLAGEIGNEVSADSMNDLFDRVRFKQLERFDEQMLWYSHYCFVLEK